MGDDTSFGQWLKKRRKALDMTQVELAHRVGCAVITIQKIEANQRRPSKQMAGLLAEHLGISIGERQAFISFARLGAKAHRPASNDLGWNMSPHHLTNLPSPPTPLIGRDQDVTAICNHLSGGDTRLLTLVGPPGVGKTRLAIEVAAGLLDYFDDGVYFVGLAHVSDAKLVPTAIAQTLGVNKPADRSFADRIKSYLGAKHMLLLLDNFEQVVRGATFLSELLAECPWVSMLVTSRTPLRVQPERQSPVSPLAMPGDGKAGFDPTELMKFSAIKLFVERAQAVKPDFNLNTENTGAVRAICACLDGLPLAIELVAAQTKVLPPQTLLERLSGRRLLHTAGFYDVSDRHNTLNNAIDWSYDLLMPEEQYLLRRVAIFVGGWSLNAAECVSDAPDDLSSSTTLDKLIALVNGNLILQQEYDGKPRFALLETVRAYAQERLAEKGEEETMRQRHAEYYLALAEESEPHLHTAAQKVWLDRLDIEQGNLRSSLAWFIDHGEDTDKGLRMAGALGWFWIMRGHVSEGRGWLQKALHKASDPRSAPHAKALDKAAGLAWNQGDLVSGRSFIKESVALYRELGVSYRWELAVSLSAQGMVAAYQADHDATQAAAEESVALFRKVGDKWGLALALNPLGEACLLRHDYATARSCFDESLALFREVGDKWGAGMPLLNWGYMDSLEGNYEAARVRLEESIALHREVGERWTRSTSLNILAQVAQQQGDYRSAAAHYRECLDLLEKMGLEASVADVQYNLAHMTQAQGHYQLAARLYEQSLDLFSRQRNEDGIAKCRAGLATIADTKHETAESARNDAWQKFE